MTEGELLQMKTIINLDREGDRGVCTTFGALADPTRYFIFRILVRKEGFCVSDIAEIVEISISATSQHLKVLEENGLVIRNRNGRKVCYEVNEQNSFVNSTIMHMRET